MVENITEDLFATVVGLKNYKGNQVFKLGSIIKLIKEPDNDFDTEAIRCELNYIGKTGYLANSTKTVIKGTMSAGRIYDKIADVSFAEVKFIADDSVIAKVLTTTEIDELLKAHENDEFFNLEDE